MRVRNRHSAALSPPGAYLAPGGECDLDASAEKNPAVLAWISAGWLEPVKVEPAAPEVNPEKPESKKPGRR